MNETYVTITGNVVDAPVRRTTSAGVPFVTFRLASTTRHLDAASGRYLDGGTSYVNVSAFRRLAINVDSSLRRGHPVIVHGRLRINRWANGERSGTSVDIDARAIGHDLNRGVARFERTGLLPDRDRSDAAAAADAPMPQRDSPADPEPAPARAAG